MIDLDAYYIACHLKVAKVFALSIKNILYQAGKDVRAEMDQKCFIS